MKICFFAENYFKGGIDTFITNLIISWPDPEDEITLLCNSDYPGLPDLIGNKKLNINVQTYVRPSFLRPREINSKNLLLQPQLSEKFTNFLHNITEYFIVFPYFILKFSQLFRNSDYERILSINGGYPGGNAVRASVIAWAFSGKDSDAIFSFHSSATSPKKPYKLIEFLIDKLLIWSASNITTVSAACVESMRNRTSFRKTNKLNFIHNGIQDPLLGKSDLDSPLGLVNSSSSYSLMLATYHAYKGHYFLLQSIKIAQQEIPDIKVHIYGDGSLLEIENIRSGIIELGLQKNIEIHSYVSQTYDLIKNARMMLVPSQAFEGFGLTIIEAFAHGIPVVATNVGAIPEVLGASGAGILCSKDDPNEFAKAMVMLLLRPEVAKSMGIKGRSLFEREFTAKTMASKYKSIIDTA